MTLFCGSTVNYGVASTETTVVNSEEDRHLYLRLMTGVARPFQSYRDPNSTRSQLTKMLQSLCGFMNSTFVSCENQVGIRKVNLGNGGKLERTAQEKAITLVDLSLWPFSPAGRLLCKQNRFAPKLRAQGQGLVVVWLR